LLVYLTLFIGDLSWTGITPLIPTYISAYHLTDLQGGLVLSIASLGILIASLPASAITSRVSARTLTLSSIALITVAGFGMGLTHTYPGVVLARLVFGLGFGTMWVAISIWLAEAGGRHSAKVLAGTTAVVGISSMLGPAYTGWVAHRWGTDAPFTGLAVISGVLLVLLALDRSGTGWVKEPAPTARELVASVRRDRDLQVMLLLTIANAVLWMTAELLVPLRLSSAGYNVARIGILFSVASLVYFLSSAATARFAERLAKPAIAGAATLGLAVAAIVPALAAGVPAVLVFLVVAALTSGVGTALIYPFGLLAVSRGMVTVAIMTALQNIIWALSGIAGPTVGGAFSQWAGDQWAFAVLALASGAGALLVLRFRAPVRR